MKRTLFLIFMTALLAGCGAVVTSEQENSTQSVKEADIKSDVADSVAVDGALQEGTRVIELNGGFSNISVYRGETVRIILRGDGQLSLSAPDFDVISEGTQEVWIEIKAVDVGTYDIVALSGDQKNEGALVVKAYEQQGVYQSVNAEDFDAAMTGDYLLLDVRTQTEHDSGHIAGARLIPHTQLAQRLDELEGHTKILVYCASGNRSVAASQLLIDAGFDEVYDLSGGISAWRAYERQNTPCY